MHEQIPASEALSALLSTQLSVAEVYSTFLHMSRDGEEFLWKRMLEDELSHVDYLKNLIFGDFSLDFSLPFINVSRMREVCEKVRDHSSELFLLRLEGALRVEAAELNYSLEGLVARKTRIFHLFPGFPGNIAHHIETLLAEARRYSHSPNIGMQITRVTELYETCLSSVEHDSSQDN